jgi:putative endopeptidase
MTTKEDRLEPYEKDGYLKDVHPLTRPRTNGVASMMDDYYRVFDVKETDAMYVAPEDRVRLW